MPGFSYWQDSWTGRHGIRFPFVEGDRITVTVVPRKRFARVGYLVSGSGPCDFACCSDPTAIAVTFS